MPSTEWLQKHQSSSRNIKKRKSCLMHTHCLAQQVPSARLPGVTQTCCTLVLNVPGQAHITHN